MVKHNGASSDVDDSDACFLFFNLRFRRVEVSLLLLSLSTAVMVSDKIVDSLVVSLSASHTKYKVNS